MVACYMHMLVENEGKGTLDKQVRLLVVERFVSLWVANVKTAGERAHSTALYQEVPTAKYAFKEQPQPELFLPNPPVCGLTSI